MNGNVMQKCPAPIRRDAAGPTASSGSVCGGEEKNSACNGIRIPLMKSVALETDLSRLIYLSLQKKWTENRFYFTSHLLCT
jgi:hypothetical protein